MVVDTTATASGSVGVDHIREFAGVIAREGASRNESIFATLGSFTPQAEKEASRLGLTHDCRAYNDPASYGHST